MKPQAAWRGWGVGEQNTDPSTCSLFKDFRGGGLGGQSGGGVGVGDRKRTVRRGRPGPQKGKKGVRKTKQKQDP